jgi:hypothetical protein
VQHHDAIVGEKFGAAAEKGFIEVDADMFEHADRYDPVERAGNIAIVAQQESGRTRQVLFSGAGVRGLQLLG